MRLFGVGREFRENLRTKDATEAKRLSPDAVARLCAKLDQTRAAVVGELPASSGRDIAALAGEWYRAECATYGDNPGRAEDWEETASALIDPLQQFEDPGDHATIPIEDRIHLRPDDRAEAAALLRAHGHVGDADTVTRMGKALFAAKLDFANEMARRAGGDWSPDPSLVRFPPVTAPKAAAPTPRPSPVGCTFDALLSGWAADRGMKLDAKPVPRALYDRQRTIARLGAFLGHSNASVVTQADAVRWKEEMQGRDLHASTVRNDLSEMSAVWTWGLRNGKLPGANPFTGISPPKPKTKRTARRAFTDVEASLVLVAAREKSGAMRWLPWLACLTGTRISEICQADAADVLTLDGIAVIRIHDEGEDGRSLKNEDSRRTIPIHPALIAEGFLRYVASLPKGSPLFPDVPPDAVFGLRGVSGSRRVGAWVRSLGITDPHIGPNHSWRHWFIGACRRVSMHVEVRSALPGHAAKLDESAGYGDGMGTFVQVLFDAISKVSCPVDVTPEQAPAA
nr:hypothetical protein [uncultured Rhodopila sp.]